MLATQKMEFYERLEKHIETNISKFKKDKYVVTREMQDTALSLLKVRKGTKCLEGARLKFWVNEKFIPGKSGKELLCKKTKKPVLVKEDLFQVIHSLHCSIGHRKKEGTWKEVCSIYSWVKRDIIDIYITTCRTCCGDFNTTSQNSTPEVEVSDQGFMTRLILSTINMEDMPDKDYKHILIVRDCATKYTTAWPVRNMKDELISCLLQFFGQFGPPKFIHALDKNFPNLSNILKELKKYWPNLNILRGRSNHPAFEGVGERVCADLQSKLGGWMAQFDNDNGWAKGIGPSIFLMNSSNNAQSTPPFQSVFGTNPKQPDILWKTITFRGWAKEEDIPETMMNMFNMNEAEKKRKQKLETSTSPPVSPVTSSAPSSPSDTATSPQRDSKMTPKRRRIEEDDMTLDMSVEEELTPEDEIVVKIERVDEEEETTPSDKRYTYTY